MISKLTWRFAGCLALFLLFTLQICACGLDHDGGKKTSGLENNTAIAAQPQQESPKVEDQILLTVSKAIRAAHLTDRPDECLAYRFDSTTSGKAYLVEVRENHQDAS